MLVPFLRPGRPRRRAGHSRCLWGRRPPPCPVVGAPSRKPSPPSLFAGSKWRAIWGPNHAADTDSPQVLALASPGASVERLDRVPFSAGRGRHVALRQHAAARVRRREPLSPGAASPYAMLTFRNMALPARNMAGVGARGEAERFRVPGLRFQGSAKTPPRGPLEPGTTGQLGRHESGAASGVPAAPASCSSDASRVTPSAPQQAAVTGVRSLLFTFRSRGMPYGIVQPARLAVGRRTLESIVAAL